ncbi:outer membrane protein assembly factor BamE [Nocardioides sp. TRM66260-LWL]|uniref:outer membrane protein assembly factor BamE n=1 Tax=Nocardioides sp. TRM66260-LWL TaxID=2874478 RepID=UPI001CC3723B|nr:outer membrane protein assembly factor BamE [Nocardioides sp. TRM66260-LWL]MBZ5735733.1 outer membrane protein assembly factor BamE [Nocardioides sp. TRM66260-LWL]
MRRISTTLATIAVASAVAVLGPAGTASAGQGCITPAEYAKVKRGMTKAQVQRVVGSNGVQDWSRRTGGHTYEERFYSACRGLGGAVMTFRDGRLNLKKAAW